ncbi:hypothetical protein E2C01_050102 [Portunus trituberculatus]|uniref:Uncharacterized protein n=1 Tax=Portunus trituberculatus TaxID=210409 RepID=A0A5B7GF62_PORTR|nr:hypothetical protein [Portunus trituberculatus]
MEEHTCPQPIRGRADRAQPPANHINIARTIVLPTTVHHSEPPTRGGHSVLTHCQPLPIRVAAVP